ncbi:hypothetical protein N7490_007337 [Penicillium lividum]|nr:hypothetical protein N7490_007337 [Penicillium lividum]
MTGVKNHLVLAGLKCSRVEGVSTHPDIAEVQTLTKENKDIRNGLRIQIHRAGAPSKDDITEMSTGPAISGPQYISDPTIY